MAIKAIIFDFGQTLADSADGFRAAEKQAQENIFSDLASVSWLKFLEDYRKIRKQFHEKSNSSRKAMWQEVYWYYCREGNEKQLEKWEYEYWDEVKAKTKLFPETEGVLKKLAADYSIGLITNTEAQNGLGDHRLGQFPELEKLFDWAIIAGQLGVPPKPESAPFILCLKEIGVTANEAVYVGDDWRIDIWGAKNAHIQSIWLQHHSVPRRWPEVKEAVPVIKSLDRLLDLDSVLNKQRV